MTMGSVYLKRQLDSNNYDKADSSFLIRRPITKQNEKRKSDFNHTFVPYYKNSVEEYKNKEYSQKRLSTAGIISKPKSIQTWKRNYLKQNTKVNYNYNCNFIELKQIFSE